MGLGVIQAGAGIQNLPGTELLVDYEGATVVDINLKKVTIKGFDTILIPQPSMTDPNDPLLWSSKKKQLAFWVIVMNTIVFAALPGPILAPATVALTEILGVSLTQVSELSGYQLLVVGATGPLVSSLAHKYGKRPLFLFASTAGTVGTIVCVLAAEQASYRTLLAGRMLQGLGITAWESLPLSTVGDIFFLHQRGWYTAFIVASLACMSNAVAITSGVLSETLGWRYTFIVSLPFNIVGLVATILFVPETQFIRTEQPKPTPVAKAPYSYGLKPFTGEPYTERSLLMLLADVFVNLVNPAAIWTIILSGMINVFFIASVYLTAQIWSGPPYNFNIAQNGFFFTGALLGGILAISAGPICDWSASFMTRLNKGVYEAEFRIPVNLLGALVSGLGWFLFMWDVNNPTRNGYYLGAFCHGSVNFAVAVALTSANSYVLDAFPGQATEIMVLQMMVKNFCFYAFATFVNSWAAKDGAGNVFKVFGIVSLVLFATCFPMYVFGKVIRTFVFKKDRRKQVS